MTWRAARSLLVLHQQLRAGSRAAPPATEVSAWGTIGDAAHDPTSDHAPHDFPGWGDDIVTAADFPDRPDLGLDARQVLDDIRRSRDVRVKCGISHGQMFSSYTSSAGIPPWTWRTYSGSDGHFTHGHLSVVGDARADGAQPWQTIGADDMSTSWTQPLTQGTPGYAGQQRDTALAFAWQAADQANKKVDQLLAAAAADKARDDAAMTAITVLTDLVRAGGGDVTDAGVIAEVRAVGDRVYSQVAAVQAQLADTQAQLAQAQARNVRLAAALADAGVALEHADDDLPAG